MRFGSKAFAIGAISVLLTAGASWGQEHHDHDHDGRFYSGKLAMLRSHEDDAVLSDGSRYARRGGSGTLFDSPPGTDENEPSDWDYLVFWPKGDRRLLLSSDLVDGDAGTPGNQPMICEEGSYLFFGRFGEDRDWLDELRAVGDSTMGDASFQCWIDDPSLPNTEHRYYDVSWYLYGPVGTGRYSDQCITYSRTGSKTLRFEAPPAAVSPLTSLPVAQEDGCPAEVFLVTRTQENDPDTPSGYSYTRESLGFDSAPLQLTVRFAGRLL